MALLTRSQFDTLYNSPASGTFLNNSTQSIVEASMRQFAKDIEDSVLFIGDNQNTDINFFEQTDFLFSSATTIGNGFAASNSGTAAGVGPAGSATSAIGVIEHTTGSDTVAVSAITKSLFLYFGNGNTITMSFRNKIQALSDGTNTFSIYLGFGQAANAVDFTDGAYFRYTHSVNSGRYECVTANGSSRTATNSTITADTNYHIFSITVNSAGTSVSFSIDGNVVATNTTNIPTSNSTGIVFKIVKSAGTSPRLMDEDWYSLLITRSTSR